MAGANSLANLVVRLVGDGSSFTRMLDKAESDTASATATIGTETKKATSTADRALDKYGNEVKQASKENKTLAHEVDVVQTSLQGQRVRVNAAGRAIDDYGKFVKKAGMDLKSLGQKVQSVGKRMSLGLTLPILAAAGASVKLASDMEETDSKLKATFSSMGDEAETAAQRLRKSFNMGGLEAKRLLANTGDMLTGFGFSQEAALGLSLQVQELSADLASFQNLPGGAAQASDALTKALLGEREAAKALGIAILEEDVKRQVQLQRAQGIIHATERQAKAYATMQLALKQSKNAIGDVARTQGSFANQMRTLGNTVSEVALVIGQDLLPIATAMVEWAQSAIGIFLEIPAPIRVVGYALAALAAAIGPVLVVGGTLLTMMATYNAALAMTGLTTKALIVQTWLSVKAFTAQALAAGRAKITMLASAVAARASAAGTAVATAASSVMALGLKGAVVALGGLVAGFLASAKAAVLAAAAWVAANAALLGIPLLIAGVAVAAYAAGVALRRAFGLTGIEDFNRELEKGRQLSDAITKRQQKQRDSVLATADAIQDQGQKAKYLKEQIALAEKKQAGLKLQVKLQEQAVADLNTTWKNLTGNKVLKGERVALQEADAAASRHAEHLQDLRDAYNESGAGAAALANRQKLLAIDAENLNVKYEHAVEMFGKTGREAEIYELKLKGATDEQLAAAQATHEKLLAMEAEADMMKKGEALVERYRAPQAKLADQQAELNKMLAAGAIDQDTYNAAMKDAEKAAKGQGNAVRDTIDNLKEQVHTYGLNERQLLEYKLAQQGASEAETAAALAHHETLQQLTQQQAIDDYIDKVRQEAETLGMTAHELDIYKAKKAGATEAQLDGMRAAQAEQAAAKKQQDQLKKGKALIEKYKDPQQKFIDQQSELNTLLAAGAIDQQTYDKALADAKKALDETAESVDQDFNVDLSVSGVEAVEAGTAEAAARLRDYLDQRDTAQQDAQTLADAVQAAEQVQQAAQPPADVVQQVQAAEQVLTWPEDAMWALAGALEEFGQTTITGLENEQQVLTTAQQVQPVDAQPVGAPPVGASSAQRSTDHEERTEDLLGRIATATEDLSDSLQTAGL